MRKNMLEPWLIGNESITPQNFILNNSGNYDIRIRTNEKNIKLISNFKYDKSKGFIKQLQEQNVIFNKVNLIVR